MSLLLSFLDGSDMGEHIRAHDWASTQLGPIESWPQSLRTALQLALAQPQPACLCAGPSRTMIYNDACARLIGSAHPGALGRDLRQGSSELASLITPMLEPVFQGESVTLSSRRFRVADGTAWKDIWLDVTCSPLRDELGAVIAAFIVAHDVTRSVRIEQELSELDERYRLLADNLPGGAVFVIDSNRRYRLVAGEALRAVGLNPEAMVGKSVEEAVGRDRAAMYEPHLRTAFAGGQFSWEHQAFGHTFFSRGVPLHRADGTIEAVLVLSFDITERKHAEEALRESEERLQASNSLFRTVTDGLPLLISYVDENLCYRFANRAYERWYGEIEVVGKRVPEVIGKEPFERGRQAFERALKGEEVHAEVEAEYPRVGLRTVSATFIPDWRNGQVAGYIALIQDVTSQRQLERQMREADRRKDEFLATLAHELRNPLAPVRTAVQILKAPNVGEAEQRWCREVIERQVRQMARLLDDLLDASRITRGKLELRKERLPISLLVDEAIETASSLIEAKGHELEVELPTKPLLVYGDPVRLTQILGNLLTNAAKYTDRGGQLRVAVAVEGEEVVIRVRDNGIGMSEEQLSHLFAMFEQAPEAIGRSEGGLGVGLAITRGLVQLHGGSIEARSDGPGQGSEFIVRLPLRETSPPVPAG